MLRSTLLGLATAITLASSAVAQITYEGGDGTTPETAVIITGAEGSTDGVKAEYLWIEANRPGAQVLDQALLQNGDRLYDVLTIRIDGREEVIHFDITGFFGNF
jgi:hypothetical protein